MRVHFARMRGAALAHEVEQQLRSLPPCRRPRTPIPGRHATDRARMHQRLDRSGDEAVDEEIVLFDRQLFVAALQVAGAITLDAMAKREVLRASGRANGIGLDEAHAIERRAERRGRKKAAADRVAPQSVERDGHAEMAERAGFEPALGY